MNATVSAQDQIATLLADAMPERLLTFKFSASVQRRIEILVNRQKKGEISESELAELERYLLYDNLIGLAKAQAKRRDLLKSMAKPIRKKLDPEEIKRQRNFKGHDHEKIMRLIKDDGHPGAY